MTKLTTSDHRPSIYESKNSLIDFASPVIIAFCVFFNFFLCFINTKIVSVSSFHIISFEILLVGLAISCGFTRIDRVKLFWVSVLFLQFLLIAILSAFQKEFLIKPLRDIIIMPIFIILGLSAYRINFSKILLALSTAILVIALWEAFATNTFLSLFNIRQFYVSKGILPEGSRITDLDVFASGVRPDGRFLFDAPGIHRISSVFLEPVSLGFYALISGIYFISAKEGVSRFTYAAGILLSFILIWLSDARLAMGTLTITFLLRSAFLRIDHRFGILIFPSIVIFSYILYVSDALETSGEGLGARLGWTIQLLSETSIDTLAGVGGYNKTFVADSGLGYILNDQGLLGLLLFWLPPYLFLKVLPEPARVYLFGITLYLASSMMLSQAFFTLKTAALLWFCFGYLVSRNLRDENGNYHYKV